MYYALTINTDHIITGVHESMHLIAADAFSANPDLSEDTVVVIESPAEFDSFVDVRCYNEDGTRKPLVWCIENGFMPMPPNKEIINGELVDKDVPAEEQPKTLKEDLDEQFEAVRQENMTTQKASTVMFRALAQTDVIKPADALDNAGMFPLWADNIGQRAEAGSYWRHADKLYRVNAGQGHTIQADWPPDQAASLFSLTANPAEEWPEWIQPTGAHNAYKKGDKVTHGGKRWTSTVDANTWVPGAYGWVAQ
jgi:hypothetical protein